MTQLTQGSDMELRRGLQTLKDKHGQYVIPAITDMQALIEFIQADKQRSIDRAVAEALDRGQLVGVAKLLDGLWDNSYYALGEKTSKRIEEEMVYYFGKDWTHTMYEVMLWDGVSKPSCHPESVKTLAELEQQLSPTTTEDNEDI